jgi:hypothetical protein
MNNLPQRWMIPALGVLLFAGLCACIATGPGYDGGGAGGYVGIYGPEGYDYGGWGPGYHVAPPRGNERRAQQPPAHAYRAAPRSRPVPTIPTRPHRPSNPTPPHRPPNPTHPPRG